jgi:hypothetical protein
MYPILVTQTVLFGEPEWGTPFMTEKNPSQAAVISIQADRRVSLWL